MAHCFWYHLVSFCIIYLESLLINQFNLILFKVINFKEYQIKYI
jgi:hypothetical protein